MVLKDKINFSTSIVVVLLLFMLVLPRIALYLFFEPGFIGTDARLRYFPQTEELLNSFTGFFFQVGPAYSLFLLFLDKITGDMVVSAVLVQHIIGLMTGLLVFYYFKRVNLFLAAFVVAFVYSGWLALWLEHTILRESLAAFFFVLLVLVFSLAVREEKYFKIPYAFLAGFIGLILVFFRIEFIFLVVFFPLVFFFAKKEKPLNFTPLESPTSWNGDEYKSSPLFLKKMGFKVPPFLTGFKFWDKRFLKWSLGYFLPLFIVFLVWGALIFKNEARDEFQYGSLFGISYHNLAYHNFFPKIFYYENSRYPELLEKYQSTLEVHKKELGELTPANRRKEIGKMLEILFKSSEDYLSEHPELNLSVNQLMDRVYLEIIKNNTLVFLQATAINFKSHLQGVAELQTVSAKSNQVALLKVHLSGIEPSPVEDLKPASLLDRVLQVYIAAMIVFSKILFWLFLLSLPILFLKWRKMPLEIIVSFFVVFLHLSVLAIFADPSHRFRYAIDPFLYFLQLYLIFCFFALFSSKVIKLFRSLTL